MPRTTANLLSAMSNNWRLALLNTLLNENFLSLAEMSTGFLAEGSECLCQPKRWFPSVAVPVKYSYSFWSSLASTCASSPCNSWCLSNNSWNCLEVLSSTFIIILPPKLHPLHLILIPYSFPFIFISKHTRQYLPTTFLMPYVYIISWVQWSIN